MVKVEIKNKSENPFYGLKNTLALFQSAGKGEVTFHLLNAAWAEVINFKEKREMFFSLLFSIGDITARQHNLFNKNKVDSGGNAHRQTFKNVMSWMKDKLPEQYWKFVFAHLFNEYTSFDNLLSVRVKTKKKTDKVETIVKSFNSDDIEKLSQYISTVIKGNNPFDKFLVAKFLTRPRFSKRAGHKKMLPETREVMNLKGELIKQVSDLCGFSYSTVSNDKSSYNNYFGYYEWRKQFNGELESVLFSSRKILEFDESQFKNWLNKLPSSARFRVRTRLLTKDNKIKILEGETKSKWKNLGTWFLEWEGFKEKAQETQRVLEEKVRQGIATTDDEIQLKSVKKDAKVTTGAVNFQNIFSDIILGKVDKIKIQPFLDKINLPYNNLVFVDDSGSMQATYTGQPFSAFDFAAFMATICLSKNPDDSARNLLGLYSSVCRLYTGIDKMDVGANRLIQKVEKVSKPFIDPNLHFLDNLKNMRSFIAAHRTGNGTSISSIPDYLRLWTNDDPAAIEQLQNYPVWTIITDGNWNNGPSPEASINDFMMRCQNYFGFKPYIIAIDVAYNSSAGVSRFQGIENFMFLPPNPAQIEQFLLNFKDIEIMDIYTPLLSLYKSNRYVPVRASVI